MKSDQASGSEDRSSFYYFSWITIIFLSQNLVLTLTYSLRNPLSHLRIIHVDGYAYPSFDGVFVCHLD